jgi:transketolase
MTAPDLELLAREVRSKVLRMAHTGKTPHVGSALSCVDILVALYFDCMRVDPARPADESRDRFILSKGHGCMAQYATLAQRGFFPTAVLSEYARDGGRLAEHPGPGCVPGIELATGSLGHGLSVGAGLALAGKMRRLNYRVFVLLSDGECEEGSIWEAALFAPARDLDNLVVIVDYNKLSAMDRTARRLDPLAKKWEAFGWNTVEADGHNMESVTSALRTPVQPGRPLAIVAHTVKGKGVSFMEDDLEWHYRPPTASDLERALAEIHRSLPDQAAA